MPPTFKPGMHKQLTHPMQEKGGGQILLATKGENGTGRRKTCTKISTGSVVEIPEGVKH